MYHKIYHHTSYLLVRYLVCNRYGQNQHCQFTCCRKMEQSRSARDWFRHTQLVQVWSRESATGIDRLLYGLTVRWAVTGLICSELPDQVRPHLVCTWYVLRSWEVSRSIDSTSLSTDMRAISLKGLRLTREDIFDWAISLRKRRGEGEKSESTTRFLDNTGVCSSSLNCHCGL